MNDRITEQQQIEMLKKLWKEYGFSIVIGAVIALSISFGWHYYKNYKQNKAARASVIYEHMVSDVMDNELGDMTLQAKALLDHYASTPYASLANMMLAKIDVQQKKFKEAIKQLNWVAHHGSSKMLRQLARIRLARIYILQDQVNSALKLLPESKGFVFSGLIEKVRGDAYVKLKQLDKARKAYQNALNDLPESANLYALVQMELNNINQ